MGMHTLDMIRRDAAEKKVWFKIKNLGNSPNGEKVELSLLEQDNRLVYVINMSRDIIEKIEFWSGNSLRGTLTFEFSDDFTQLETSLNKQLKDAASKSAKPREAAGIWWLFDLAKGTLTK
jgi:hypothetical protein